MKTIPLFKSAFIASLVVFSITGCAQNSDAKEPVKTVSAVSEQMSKAEFDKLKKEASSAYAEENYQVAFPAMKKLAEIGNRAAQHYTAKMYQEGLGTSKNLTQAKFWFNKAAENGYADSQYSLAFIYIGEQNFKQAAYWMAKAAEQKHAEAQYTLGLFYMNGDGVAKNMKKAVYWWEKAATSGVVLAQRNLGLAYSKGDGVSQNDEKARYWFSMAAAQGDTPSISIMHRYTTDELMKSQKDIKERVGKVLKEQEKSKSKGK